MGFMGDIAEKVQHQNDKSRVLEPSGDDEHDALTAQVHELDALSPLRNNVVREHYEEIVADAEEDAEEDEGEST